MDSCWSYQEPGKPQREWENTINRVNGGMTQMLGFSDKGFKADIIKKNVSTRSYKKLEGNKNAKSQESDRTMWVRAQFEWEGLFHGCLGRVGKTRRRHVRLSPKVCTVPFLAGPQGGRGETPSGGQPCAPKGLTRVTWETAHWTFGVLYDHPNTDYTLQTSHLLLYWVIYYILIVYFFLVYCLCRFAYLTWAL